MPPGLRDPLERLAAVTQRVHSVKGRQPGPLMHPRQEGKRAQREA